MKIIKLITNWLEIHASSPTYAGWVLAGIAVCFFGAAINTMAGWLYAISGVTLALLGIAAFLASRSLVGLSVTRRQISPVSAGDELTLELEIYNPTKQSVTLLQVEDILPFVLGKPMKHGIETIASRETYRWVYYHPTEKRGIYRWHSVELATGAPLGLFWSRRQHHCEATAIVYPTVLTLSACPLVDEIGEEESQRNEYHGRPLQTATSGLVRSLRPYRIGDPTRLIHWRTSARYGELRVRELEMITSGQQVIIALDTAGNWEADNFEQAVIAAASMYFYAQHQQLQVQLLTAATGLVRGDRSVLETLAATQYHEDISDYDEQHPLIWLTQNPLSISSLPQGSRWLLWPDIQSNNEPVLVSRDYSGVVIDTAQALRSQLQKPLV